MPSVSTPVDSRTIDRHILCDSIVLRVLTDVISGRYAPGERLNVDVMAEEFGVSRTPVREALVRLAATRFIEVVRNRRTQVADWGADDMRDRLEVAGRLVGLVLSDARFDPRTLLAEVRPSEAIGPCADVHTFLALASSIVNSDVNRVAGYVLVDLITPLQLFFQPATLQHHGIDLAPTAVTRSRHLTAFFQAARHSARADAARHVDTYTTTLAGLLSPRTGDPSVRVLTSVAVPAAPRTLHPVQ